MTDQLKNELRLLFRNRITALYFTFSLIATLTSIALIHLIELSDGLQFQLSIFTLFFTGSHLLIYSVFNFSWESHHLIHYYLSGKFESLIKVKYALNIALSSLFLVLFIWIIESPNVQRHVFMVFLFNIFINNPLSLLIASKQISQTNLYDGSKSIMQQSIWHNSLLLTIVFAWLLGQNWILENSLVMGIIAVALLGFGIILRKHTLKTATNQLRKSLCI